MKQVFILLQENNFESLKDLIIYFDELVSIYKYFIYLTLSFAEYAKRKQF